MNELDITCLPGRPAGVHRGGSRATCTVGHSLHVRDLALPKGVELVDAQGREPGRRHGGRAGAHRRGRGSRSRRRGRSAPPRCRPPTQAAAPKEGEGAAAEARQERQGGKGACADKATRARQREARRREGRRRSQAVAIRLVVGLGNPGKEYERTRHNAGFWLVERFAAANGVALRKDAKFQALVRPTSSRRRLAAHAAELHERERQRGADARRLLQDQARGDPGRARRARFPAGRGAHQAGRRHRRPQRPEGHLAAHRHRTTTGGCASASAGRRPGADGADYVLQKPPARGARRRSTPSIDKALALLPQMLAGDMQSAMHKLHTEDKPPAKKEPEKKEPRSRSRRRRHRRRPQPEKKGLLSGLFGRKK